MRIWIAGLMVGLSAMVTTSDASEESRQKALNAAGIFAALAYECDDYVDGDLKAQAKADSVPTLEAGGFSSDEAKAKSAEIFTALNSSWKKTGLTEALCANMARGIVAGRPQLRLELEGAR